MKKVLFLFAILFSLAFAVSASVPPTAVPNHLVIYGQVMDQEEVTIQVYELDATGNQTLIQKIVTSESYELTLNPMGHYMIWFSTPDGYNTNLVVNLNRQVTGVRSFDLNTSDEAQHYFKMSPIHGAIEEYSRSIGELAQTSQ